GPDEHVAQAAVARVAVRGPRVFVTPAPLRQLPEGRQAQLAAGRDPLRPKRALLGEQGRVPHPEQQVPEIGVESGIRRLSHFGARLSFLRDPSFTIADLLFPFLSCPGPPCATPQSTSGSRCPPPCPSTRDPWW